MNKKYIVIAIIILSIVFILNKIKSRETVKNESALKIGVSLALTGSFAHSGESAKKGIELAEEELKREYPNINLKYYIEDNAFMGKTAVNAYRKLKDQDDIDAIITANSPATLATKPLAQQDNLLQMGIFTSVPDYSSPNDLSFRVFPRAEKEAEAIAKYIEKASLQRLGVVYINNDFGKGLFGTLKNRLLSGGIVKIIGEESYLPDTTDFRTSITKIKSADPQILLMIATAKDVVSILRQAREVNLQAEFLTTASAFDPSVLNSALEYTNGLKLSDLFDPQSTEQKAQFFIGSYQKKFGVLPDLYAAQGYDGFKLTAVTIIKCGRNEQCIKSYLMSLSDYPTIFGNLKFDNNGDPEFNYFIKEFKDGRFERIK